MWLIVRNDDVVVGTNYTREPVPPTGHTVKEWVGDEPELGSIDPTLSDPAYADFVQSGVDFRALYAQSGDEITWLNENIPLVPSADLDALRGYLQRVMQENRMVVKSIRYLARRLR